MLRVPVDRIEPGMVLARPISLERCAPGFVLPREHAISTDVVSMLVKHGIREVWIRSTDLEFLEEALDQELVEHQRAVYRQVRCNFEKIMRGTNPEVDFDHFRESLSDLFDYLKRSRCGDVLLHKVDNYDDYLLSHSTNVCYLALVLGMRLEQYIAEQQSGYRTDEGSHIQLLGMGCLLHDVGKTRIPVDILNKPRRLTADEMELVRRHPVYGYEMVKGQVPAAVADVILNHHQRFNGAGYPARVDLRTGETLPSLAGEQISIYSRIATVVDIYDAATSHRCYSGAKPSVQVLHEMRTACRGFFDPRVEETFYQIIPPFPIGQIVRLSDGVEAVVVDFNSDCPACPKVQGIRDPRGGLYADPARQEIDLALTDDVAIVEVGGVDVRPFVASQMPVLELAGQPFGGSPLDAPV